MSFTTSSTNQDIIQKGTEIIEAKYIDQWKKYCTNFHNSWSFYGDTVLDCALIVIKELNDDKPFYDVKEILRKQNHSGLSYSLISGIVSSFCSKGAEFLKYTDAHWYD